MTAAPTQSTSASDTGAASTAQLLADLTSTSEAVPAQGWLAGQLGIGTGDLSDLAAVNSPLGALDNAGFGYVRPSVSFLDEPLNQLVGDPGTISAAAAGANGVGAGLASIAGTYRSSLSAQTGSWTGTAADSYRTAGAGYADGIAALGEAASTVGSAISGAGQAVAQTAHGVRQDIADAVGEMLPILTQARAQAEASSSSMAQVIPACVRIAQEYAQRSADRMQALLSSGQNLEALLAKVWQGTEAVVKTAFQQSSDGKPIDHNPGPTTGGPPTGGSDPSGGPGTSSTSGQQSGTNSPANSASSAANQSSTDQPSPSTSTSDATDPSDSTGTGTGIGTDGTTSSYPSLGSTAIPSTAATVPSAALAGAVLPTGLSSSLTGPSELSKSGTAGGASLSSGARSGANAAAGEGGEGAATEGAAVAESETSPTEGGAMGGGARGARREEDKEHQTPGWLRGDSGLFESDTLVAPAVIEAPPGE